MIVVCHAEGCPRYRQRGQPMKQIDETHWHWVFACPTCENIRAVDKFRAGGTLGAGRREDHPALKYSGRGF